MVKSMMALAAVASLAACAQTPAQTARAAQDAAASQMALRKEIAGLTPRGDLTCLPTVPSTQLKAYGTALVYVASPRLKYVSQTNGGCESVGTRDDILVTRSNGGRTCQGDIAQTYDRSARFPTGGCALGRFTEYRR